MRDTPVRCTPVRYTLMRHPPIRCTLVGCMLVRYVLIFENSFVVLDAEPGLAVMSRSAAAGSSRICLWPEMSVEYVCPESSREVPLKPRPAEEPEDMPKRNARK